MHTWRMPCEGQDRDWGGTSHIAVKPSEAGGKAWNGISLTASEEASPADTWVLDFWPPEPCDNEFLLLKRRSMWYLAMAALANHTGRAEARGLPGGAVEGGSMQRLYSGAWGWAWGGSWRWGRGTSNSRFGPGPGSGDGSCRPGLAWGLDP